MSEQPNGEQPEGDAQSDGEESAYAAVGSNRGVVVGAALGFAVVAFGIGYWTGGGADAAPGGSTSGESAEKSSQQFTCPMHPGVRSDDPDDTCPICGMDLVSVDETGGGADDGVPALELSDRALEVAKVQTQKAERRPLTREIEAYGRVEVAEEAETDITSWVRGRIEHLDIRAEGQRIHRGQRVARLYSPKLESVQKELLQALRTAERADQGEDDEPTAREQSAKSAVEAAKSRLRVLGMKPAQIEKIVEKREVREVVDVYADTGGTVREREVFEGDWVDVGDAIASLHGLDTVWIQLEIYESDLSFVDEGTPATVRFPNRPDVELDSRVEFVDPVVNPKNGTAEARIVASNEDGTLPPGTDVRATIEASIDGDPPPVSVPETAVLWTGPRSLVYRYETDRDPPAFVPTEVELGPKAGERRVIREGLSEGDVVASQGAFRLDAELQIRGESSMMSGFDGAESSRDSPEPVEVPEDGGEFDPGVSKDRLPDGVWYCPMDPVHWAQRTEGDGECPICAMDLKQKSGGDEEASGGGDGSGRGEMDHGSHDEMDNSGHEGEEQ
jgi:Cu(I)/Ag(I) efflux system membrane fusion protein